MKEQKTFQKDKRFCPLHSISQEPYIIWLSFVVYICKMIIAPGFLFIFSKFWFCRFLMGKRTKNDLKRQKICQFHSISQKPYIIWLSCMVHFCKMTISPGVFFFVCFFSISQNVFTFWVVRREGRGVKGQKMVQGDRKFCLLFSISQESYIWFSFHPYISGSIHCQCHIQRFFGDTVTYTTNFLGETVT